ncbi:MAG: hypothetical protein U0103_10785 [Candidatus Obscuribacterales bacterium]|nr:hypothetical protein [Cyanobacteria bacterium SZAS LIN-5]RTL41505.1 MAG: hypothetical protein EKK48_14165 [Candidatus Melainabacteria bacterium]
MISRASASIVVALGFALLLHASSASAQQNKPKKVLPPIRTKPLAAPLALPDVPQYGGQARFISGEKVDVAGENLRQTWHIREHRAEVVNWYKQALANAGWTIAAATKGSVTGIKKDGLIMIVVNELPLADNYRSELMIQYSRK